MLDGAMVLKVVEKISSRLLDSGSFVFSNVLS